MAGKGVKHQAVGAVRQARVGVQEQQHIAGGDCRAGIHLRCAPRRCGDHVVGEGLGKSGGAVAAAAIDHDDLGAIGAQGRQGDERRLDAGGLVEHRHDDGQGHGAAARVSA